MKRDKRLAIFFEVYVNTSLAVCELRDPKELYKKARAGKIRGLAGVDDAYEPPFAAEIVLSLNMRVHRESSRKVATAVLSYLSSKGAKD